MLPHRKHIKKQYSNLCHSNRWCVYPSHCGHAVHKECVSKQTPLGGFSACPLTPQLSILSSSGTQFWALHPLLLLSVALLPGLQDTAQESPNYLFYHVHSFLTPISTSINEKSNLINESTHVDREVITPGCVAFPRGLIFLIFLNRDIINLGNEGLLWKLNCSWLEFSQCACTRGGGEGDFGSLAALCPSNQIICILIKILPLLPPS